MAAFRPNEVAIKKVLNKKIITMLAISTMPKRAAQAKLRIDAIPMHIKPEKSGRSAKEEFIVFLFTQSF